MADAVRDALFPGTSPVSTHRPIRKTCKVTHTSLGCMPANEQQHLVYGEINGGAMLKRAGSRIGKASL